MHTKNFSRNYFILVIHPSLVCDWQILYTCEILSIPEVVIIVHKATLHFYNTEKVLQTFVLCCFHLPRISSPRMIFKSWTEKS